MRGLKLGRLPLPLVKLCGCSTDIRRQIEPEKTQGGVKTPVDRILVLLVLLEENSDI